MVQVCSGTGVGCTGSVAGGDTGTSAGVGVGAGVDTEIGVGTGLGAGVSLRQPTFAWQAPVTANPLFEAAHKFPAPSLRG